MRFVILIILTIFISGCSTREWDRSTDKFEYEQRYKERAVHEKESEKKYLNDISKSRF